MAPKGKKLMVSRQRRCKDGDTNGQRQPDATDANRSPEHRQRPCDTHDVSSASETPFCNSRQGHDLLKTSAHIGTSSLGTLKKTHGPASGTKLLKLPPGTRIRVELTSAGTCKDDNWVTRVGAVARTHVPISYHHWTNPPPCVDPDHWHITCERWMTEEYGHRGLQSQIDNILTKHEYLQKMMDHRDKMEKMANEMSDMRRSVQQMEKLIVLFSQHSGHHPNIDHTRSSYDNDHCRGSVEA